MAFLPSSYDAQTVVASLLIASLASYVTLDLVQRVRSGDRNHAVAWGTGGSIVMGTGIWCMHFVGMLAFELPIELGYERGLTFASWGAAVLASAIALFIASRSRLTGLSLVGGAAAIGSGICVMHYTGMAALDMAPGIVWDRGLVVASAGVAFGAAAAALQIFFWLVRVENPRRRFAYQLCAALVMGLAIVGMHYTGMAAANFPVGALCLSADALRGQDLGVLVTITSVSLMVATLLISVLDARLYRRTARLTRSLQTANAQLESVNEELRRHAFLDPLTRLPNRTLFDDRLAHALQRRARAEDRLKDRSNDRLAVIFVDLDGFKPINDSLGHAAGDEVLQEVASRLQASARLSDTVARIGGDEFVLLLEDVPSVADAVAAARRLVESMAQPIEAGGRRVSVFASVGMVVHPDQGEPDKLLAHADAAMYVAKRAGGNTYAVFEAGMDVGQGEQFALIQDLREALENQQLRLYYQPKIDGRTGRIRGVEALLRWQHPQRGWVPPAEFIPLAERFGMIGRLGSWVIDEACRQIEAWAQRGLRLRVAINLSAHQLREPDLVDRIHRAVTRHGLDASQLLCEITESVAMEDVRATQEVFDGLAAHGVYLSIDDFGTGYSSLSYLRKLPARQLKIDRSFIADIEDDADARAVVGAVISLARQLGLRVVAEGVETRQQHDRLVEMGCDELQGYHFARPMSPEALVAWSEGHRPEGAVDFSPSVIQADLI